VLKHFSITPPKNSSGAEKSTENSGSHAKNFFCSMYEMSQRHPVWVTENHLNPCNSAIHISHYTVTRLDVIFRYTGRVPLTHFVHRAKKVFSMWA
jgi:hypothetical protein